MPTLLKTNVSQAFWFNPTGGARSFEPAQIPNMKKARDSDDMVCWLDKLFEGGIVLPDQPVQGTRALTFLVTGPPGSGKSTLAMELAYRLADKGSLSSLYITSETDEKWMIEKAQSFAWPDIDRLFMPQGGEGEGPPVPMVMIWKTTDFNRYFQHGAQLPKSVNAILSVLSGMLPPLQDLPSFVGGAYQQFTNSKLESRIRVKDPDILVIDSLNTLRTTEREETFNKFFALASAGPKILLIIAESGGTGGEVEFWEYLADIVVRLDRKYIADYMVRTIEVVKARNQPHVWGVHQLKIYPPFKPERSADESKGSQKEKEKKEELRRAHPYREEGGIFIFPSIHYYLSVYKRLQPEKPPEYVKTPLDLLNDVFKGGLPQGRCTGFIGSRGGHKSHLGYLHLLSRVVKKREKGIVISLRDDEGTARKTMEGILRSELGYDGSLDEIEADGRLEILFYPPGYITAEEFFHRMYMSVHRLKNRGGSREITLLFNSLDQLSSRFPLCAHEQVFIPGIIEILTAEEVTSLFIAVEEKGQPPEQYGLLSMADALVSFHPQQFTREAYCGHVRAAHWPPDAPDPMPHLDERIGPHWQTVVLRVVRFAGGQAAGAGGMLELVDSRSPELFELYRERRGLQFTPFSAKYSDKEGT